MQCGTTFSTYVQISPLVRYKPTIWMELQKQASSHSCARKLRIMDSRSWPYKRYLAIAGTIFLLCSGFQPCSSAKILLSHARLMQTPSHLISLSGICKALVDHGHEVVVFTARGNSLKGLSTGAYSRVIYFDMSHTEAEVEGKMKAMSKILTPGNNDTISMWEKLQIMSSMRVMLVEGCEMMFRETETLRALKDERFDMVLTMPMAGCDIMLAVYLEVPFVLHTPVNRLPTVTEDHFGIPAPISYVPFSFFMTMTDSMSFIERVGNFVLRFIFHPVFEWFLTRPIVAIKEEYQIRPDLSLGQLTGLADLWLCSADFAIEFAHPTAPMWIPIGGITFKEPSPLPHVSENKN